MRISRFIVAVFLCSMTLLSYGQPSKVNSISIIKDGAALYEKQKYKDAIVLYKQIPRSDSNYRAGLFNLSLAYYADSNYTESIKIAEEGLRLYPEKSDEWWGMIANSLDNMDKQTEAIKYYDKIIENYRFPYLAIFNKGIAYYRLKNFAEARNNFQQCVLINPYYGPAHYYLGIISSDEGNLVPAMLSFTTYLLVNPDGKYSARSIYMLNAIAKITDETSKNVAKYKATSKDNYEEIQEILVSKIALDRQYKIKADLEDPIVRQLQVVFEKIKYNPDDKGFAMQYYVSLFEKVLKDDQFEPMMYFIFSSVSMAEIEKYVKRNKSKISEVAQWYASYFNEIRSTQILIPAQRKAVTEPYIYIDGEPFGKGKTEGQGSKSILVGPWEFYHKNGKLKSKGTLNQKQDKIGEWLFYYDNGQMKEKSGFADGKANGKSQSWYDNGNMLGEEIYKNGEEDGKATYYFYNGLVKRIVNYKNGKKEGAETGYTASGNLSYKTSYKDDKEDGERTDYYNNGNMSTKATYAKGDPIGNFKKFYLDGTLSMEGSVAEGKRSGTWKEYYNNGKLKAAYNYNANEIEGEYKEYYDNGKVMYQTNYVKNKLEGKYEDFDTDGKLYSESMYEKGRLRDMKFYDKDGKIISNSTSRNGSGNFTYFDPEGNKTSEGYFTKEGMRNGKSTFYYRNGKVKSTAEYKEGLLQGEKISYYVNGALAAKNLYKDDEQNGYQITYYMNSNKKHEGELQNGYRVGLHIDYDILGNVYSKTDYKNGDIEGYLEYYHPTGKMDHEMRFSDGWIQNIRQFDTTGKIIADVDFPTGSGAYTFKNYAGTNFIQSAYKHYNLNGEYKVTFANGNISQVHYNKYGNKDSIQKKFYINGKTEFEGKFRMDERDGKWTYYHENGKLHYSETYNLGRLNDTLQLYNDDGTLERELPYTEGDYNGDYKIYGDDNQLAVVIKYEKGAVKGFAYEDKTGKLLPLIPFKSGTGKVLAYYKNGTKSAEIEFEEDEVNGKRNVYFTNGKPYFEGLRIAGDDNGVKKTYYKNGQLKKEENYYYGNLHGSVKEWWDNGKPKSEEFYYDGDRHGVKKVYDNTGKLNQTFTYYFGVLQSVK